VTGVVIWMRKRKARVAQKRKVKEQSASAPPQPSGRESTFLS